MIDYLILQMAISVATCLIYLVFKSFSEFQIGLEQVFQKLEMV